MDKTAKKEEASIAHEKSGILKEAGLFNVYPIFALEWDRLQGEYATYVGNTPLLIKEATKAFFIHKFSDKIVDVDFKNKPSVIEHGLLNMIELFIYKLLEIIGVGANVEIIPNLVTSDRIVYICGEEIPGFKTIAILEEN
uniref:Uncharacterized protein n=1 Tax=Acrobeloides nanus TaxID=290746 RepID=A0A914C4W7_9BILA